MIKIIFMDNQVTEYPEGEGVSHSPDGMLAFVNDMNGNALAALVAMDVKEVVKG